MDTAKEVDDDRAGGGLSGHIILGEEHVGKQDAQAGAGVGFQHVHDGLTGFFNLCSTDGCEDTVVDGVVQEQDLGRLDKDGCQRQKVRVDQRVDTCCQDIHDGCHQRAHDIAAENGQQHAQDTD